MNCTKEYKEHIEYTFHAFCKIVIHHAAITAARTAGRKQKHEISLEYLAEEKHYPFATEDEYFKAPEQYEEYPVSFCGDTVIFYNGLLAKALSRLPRQEQEMIYLSFFQRVPQHEIGRRYQCSRSAAGYHIRKSLRQLQTEMGKRRMRNRKLLPYETIVQATSGEPEAVHAVLSHYAGYIRYRARSFGNSNSDIEDYIQTKLIESLFKFRFL